MKRCAFLTALIASKGLALSRDLAAVEADTWCVTYLSTYLAEVNAPGAEKTDTGRDPIPPSVRPTFGGNTSIATTSTFSGTSSDQETSLLPQSFSTSIALDVSSSTNEPANTASDFVASSSDQTTEAASATTSITEPAGRSVIFLVLLAGNEERSNKVNKRATGGFVGNENPDICSFASIFNLADGQLFQGGLSIYYSGEDYKELIGEDSPPPDAITKTFTSQGQRLAFVNENLPNGRAGFCQDSNGLVYITFTTGPSDCEPIELAAYAASQCQDGQLIGGPESLTTTAFGTTTLDIVVSEDSGTTTIQDVTVSLSSESTSLSSSQISSAVFNPETSTPTPSDTSEPSTSVDATSVTASTQVDTDTPTLFPSTIPTTELSSETPSSVESKRLPDTSQGTTSSSVIEPSSEISITSDDITSGVSSEEDNTSQLLTTSEADIPSTTADACVEGITASAGDPPLAQRSGDCEEYNVVTISPYTVTTTILSKRWEARIPTGWPTPRPTNKQLARRQDTASTIFPSETPAYATYCDSAGDYYEACSVLGITASTTELPTPTKTVSDEEPACRGMSMVKRAGEAMGYEFEDHWDLHRMPGWRYY
ncbi:hypothetical protein ACLX1H_000393 [Fusarium chlamydosporum]